ncbi:MAG: hypothetical protein JWR62_1397 [Modestobacter sp.]|jgi:steroid 5-alpha reductase family enzyme|nr:hypothetical protein [Modestobacter sp.]
MNPPAAPPRHARPVDPAPPPAAIACAVVALVGGLVLVYLAFLVVALGGLSNDGADRVWGVLPLAAGLAAAVGGLRVLRRRGWWLLGLATLLAAAFVAVLVARSAGLEETPPVGMALLLLAGPVVALALALTLPVRRWLSSP